MTRGIQLKTLTPTDLGLLGLPEDLLPVSPRTQEQVLPDAPESPLAAVVCEIREGLEGTLQLLDAALAAQPGNRADPDGHK